MRIGDWSSDVCSSDLAARVHRDDLVIETGEATLIFGDQLWIETARPIPRHFDLDPSPVGRHRLAAIAIPAVGPLILLTKMVIHLRIEGPFGKSLLQEIEQPALAEGRCRLSASQQLVENVVRYRGIFPSLHPGSPSFPFCLPAHDITSRPQPAPPQH